jgi:hypothetical protein
MDNDKLTARDTLKELRQIRDQIRVKIRLGEMEAKAWWDEVEPQLETLESRLENGLDRAANIADAFVDELTEAFRRVRKRIEA